MISDLQAAWFILTALLLIAYAILDGFDLGVGVLYPWLTRSEDERASLRASIGPVWDGNEVWLIVLGGVLFAAFPAVYASVLSGFYLLFMLVFFSLIIRGVSLSLHHVEKEHGNMRSAGLFVGSLLPTFFFGLFAGNLIHGISLSPSGDHIGGLGEFFHPYPVLIGLVAVAMFANQGASWVTLKTHGDLRARAKRVRTVGGWVLLAVAIAATISTIWAARGSMSHNGHRWLGWLAMAALLLGIAFQLGISRRPDDPLGRRDRLVFVASSASIAGIIGLWAVGNYPVLVPARNAPGSDITAAVAASNHFALVILLIGAILGIPLMLAYTIIVYRLFRGRAAIGGSTETGGGGY